MSSYRWLKITTTFLFQISSVKEKNPHNINDLKPIATDTTSKGLSAYLEGHAYDEKSLHQEAVECFTEAIKYGYSNIMVYLRRGCSFQLLYKHELAIHDFSRVIAHRQDDYYPFFLRAVSKYKIGDIKGAILDLEETIKLSLVENETNDEYREVALKLGWGSHTALYEAYLNNYKMNMD